MWELEDKGMPTTSSLLPRRKRVDAIGHNGTFTDHVLLVGKVTVTVLLVVCFPSLFSIQWPPKAGRPASPLGGIGQLSQGLS